MIIIYKNLKIKLLIKLNQYISTKPTT